MENLVNIFGDYEAKQIEAGTWIISFMNGSQYLYLLEGEEKALLIDTGYGAGNLRAYVEGLTENPIMVVNTHFHPDHAGGNGEFQEVYMHRDAKVDEASVYTPGATPFDLSKLPYPNYEKKTLQHGESIDLGGRRIEVWEAAPAHCNSSLMFLDKDNGMVFVGDEFEAGQVLLFDNSKNPDAPYEVNERLQNLKKNAEDLYELKTLWRYVFPNHNGTPIDVEYLKEFSELVDAIYDESAVVEDKLNHPFIEMDPIAEKLCRVRHKRVSIFIEKEQLDYVKNRNKYI